MLLESLREDVCRQNKRLPAEGLVRGTSGNVSGRDPETNRMVIKPSGVPFEEIAPATMVVMEMDGTVAEGECKPSSDAYTHLVVYRAREDVHGMVHTHSNYATAWAALGKPIPVCLTAHCDEFGRAIPVGDFRLIGHEQIGEEILRRIGDCTAILMRNHGVFTIGASPAKAVKAAVALEDIARTMAIASAMGAPLVIDPENVAAAHRRYRNDYGQGR
jgi:L-ribulose-5-phosphate 4-epimerase